MKNKVLKRLLTIGLVLGLLLPCVMTMPVSAAQGEEDPGTVLYSKTAEDLSSETKIHNFWEPNTRDAVNVAPDRRDIGLLGKVKLKGPQMDGTFRGVQITNETKYNDAGEFDYGLPLKEDGTSDTLSLTLKKGSDGNALSLDTGDYGEMELTFQYIRGEHYRHVGLIDDFQVYVSTDGGKTWSEDYVGIKSHRTVAVGALNNGSGNPVQCHEVKSKDLTTLVEDGAVINAIKIRPFGDYTHPSYGTYATFVRAIEITGYETKAPGEDIEYVAVPENILRQIVVKHAERLMAAKWTSDTTIMTANGSSTITYKAGTQYKGPAYSRNIGSTYELFTSAIDAQGNYIGGKTDETIYGMDCLTVVNECISQITSSKSAHSWYYMFYDLFDQTKNPDGKLIPLYTLTEADGIERYTMEDIFWDEFTQNEMYGYYDQLQAGDLVMSEGHAMLVSRGHKGTETTLGISETAGAIKNNSSLRIDRDGTYSSLYYGAYYPITLTEYAEGKVEKEAVSIHTNAPEDFISAGFYADMASNYTIRQYALTLTNKRTKEELYTNTQYGINSDFNVCFTDTDLNTALKALEEKPGKYELKVEVLSGPRIYLADGSVIDDVADAANTVNPTTTFTYDLEVAGEEELPGPGRAADCTENHTGWQGVDQDYLDGALDSTQARYILDGSLTYYLTEDVELEYPVYFGKTGAGTLCLNGHDIISTSITKGENDDGVITVCANSTLDICNCKEEQGGNITVTASVSDTENNFSVLRVEAPEGEEGSCAINIFEHVTFANCTAKLISVPAHKGTAVNLVGGNFVGSPVVLESGVLNMYRGAISGNAGSAGVTVTVDATFNMSGGTISGNKQGVSNKGTFNMSGGTISGNSGSSQGAGVNTTGTFVMSGNAVIKGNTTTANRAGGVYNTGNFTMNGGTIGGKSAEDANKCTGTIAGGGVYTTGPFTMNGGSIMGNSALRGGGVTVAGGSFVMNGGTITKNAISKTAAGAGLLVGYSSAATYGTVTINGGIISGNTASAGTLYDVSVWVGSYTQKGADTKVDSVYAYTYTAEPVTIKIEGGTTKTVASRNTTSVIGKDITISGGTFGMGTDEIMQYLANVPVRLQATNKNGWANETTVTKGFARTSEVFDFTGSLDLALSLQCDNDFVTDNPDYKYRYTVGTGAGTAELVRTDDGVLTLATKGITAKEMGDEIEFKVMSEDGSEVFYQESLSVYDFAKEQYNATQEGSYRTLLEDMVNYGNAAAAEFGEGATMTPLGEGTVELQGSWEHSENYGAPVDELVAATLSLKDKVELNVYFNGVASDVTDGEKNYTVSSANSTGDITCVKLDDIALADAMKPIELTFELGGQEYTVTYSIKDYVIDALADQNNDQWSLMETLQKFIDSVCAIVNL